MKKTLMLMIVVFTVLVTGNVVIAHEAPVDKDGCHLDRDNRKHCH